MKLSKTYSTIEVTDPRTVNVKRYIVKSKDGQYLKNIDGELTTNINESYQFKRIPRAKYYGKKYNLHEVRSCNVKQVREAVYEIPFRPYVK